MKEIQYPINISAPDLVNMCVDESCDGEVAGRLYHCYRKEELCFSNLVQLLRMMEKFFDAVNEKVRNWWLAENYEDWIVLYDVFDHDLKTPLKAWQRYEPDWSVEG